MRGWHTVPLTPTPQHGQHDAPPITQLQLHPYTLHQPGSQRLSHQPGQHSLRQAGQTKTAAGHSPLVPPPLANTTTPASAANAKRSLPATPPKPRTQGHAAAKVTPSQLPPARRRQAADATAHDQRTRVDRVSHSAMQSDPILAAHATAPLPHATANATAQPRTRRPTPQERREPRRARQRPLRLSAAYASFTREPRTPQPSILRGRDHE